MWVKWYFCFLCVMSYLLSAESSQLDKEQKIMSKFLYKFGDLTKYEKMPVNMRIYDFVSRIANDPEMKKYAIAEAEKLGFSKRDNVPELTESFPCKPYNVTRHGLNINTLIPEDIKVIGAMGDSLTAGLGIDSTSILNLLIENKGKVFDIGGQKGAQTLTNILRVYNPNIIGYSMINSTIHSKTDALNVAVSSATAKDIDGQADLLISRMKADPRINMEKDWKLITILIGNNDVCRSCEFWNKKDYTIQLFVERMQKTLDKLKANVPRAFVSIVTMLDVYEVKNMNIGVVCSIAHLISCPCVAYSWNINNVFKYTTKLQNAMFSIVANGRYDNDDDFTVVVQPFFQKTFVPQKNGKPDLSYFAPDCFHLSQKGHGQVALSLWNGLFDKVGSKRTSWHAGEKFDCPNTSNPYFSTRENS